MNKLNKKIIAICSNIEKLDGNRVFDKEYAKDFPGALWCYYFKKSMAKRGIEVLMGDLAFMPGGFTTKRPNWLKFILTEFYLQYALKTQHISCILPKK